MKNCLYSILFAGLMLASCKKEKSIQKPLGTITMINATGEIRTIKAEVDGNPSVYNIGYYSLTNAIVNPGKHTFLVYPESDKTNVAFDGSIDVKAGELYSLYLFGTPGHLENLLVKEKPYPVYSANQSGVRVINLNPGSEPVNVTLVEASGATQFSNVSYRQATDFKVFDSLLDQNFTFEIRKASDNSLITTFGTTLPLHENLTLVINGPDASQNVYVFPVKHFSF